MVKTVLLYIVMKAILIPGCQNEWFFSPIRGIIILNGFKLFLVSLPVLTMNGLPPFPPCNPAVQHTALLGGNSDMANAALVPLCPVFAWVSVLHSLSSAQ